jgi:hypothetical protein
MKRHRGLFLVLVFGLLCASRIFAQDPPTTPSEAAADLHARLVEVQAREAERHARLNQLDEALQPQNIERSLAGIGSTRPEELREQRRRELTIERDGVRRQLDLLANSRVRLESAIQDADNRAYQQSAQGFVLNQIKATRMYSPRWLLIPFITIVGLLAAGYLVLRIRKL